MAGIDIISDSTGKEIVAAIQSTDVAQARISEINAAAEAKKKEVLESIPEDYSNIVNDISELKGDLTQLALDIYENCNDLIAYVINTGKFTKDYYINRDNNECPLSGFYMSDYIPARNIKKIKGKFNIGGVQQANFINIYDGEKNILSGNRGNEATYELLDSYYIRFNFYYSENGIIDKNELYLDIVEKKAETYLKIGKENIDKGNEESGKSLVTTENGVEWKEIDVEYDDTKIKNTINDIYNNYNDLIDYVVCTSKYTKDYYIDKSGVLHPLSGFYVSDYIDVRPINNIKGKFFKDGSQQANFIVAYDSDRNIITGYNGSEATLDLENVSYIRFNFSFADGKVDKSQVFLNYTSKNINWLNVKPENIDRTSAVVGNVLTATENGVEWKEPKSIGGTTEIETNTSKTVIAKKINFVGNTIVGFGDSIMRGWTSVNGGTSFYSDNCWLNVFKTIVGANVATNAGINGSTLATGTGYNSVYDRISNYTPSENIIFISAGTNDVTCGAEIGSLSDTSTETVYGALNGICSVLAEKFSDKSVIFITPINRQDLSSANKDRLNKIRDAIYEVATLNNHSVIDGRCIPFPIDVGDYQIQMMADKLHPTELGYQMYANTIAYMVGAYVNIPNATTKVKGLVQFNEKYGLGVNGGVPYIVGANSSIIKGRTSNMYPIVSNSYDYAVKLAMTDGIGSEWTDVERLACLLRMGCTVDDNGFVKWEVSE